MRHIDTDIHTLSNQQIKVKLSNFRLLYYLTKSILSLIKEQVRVEKEWQTEKYIHVQNKSCAHLVR